MYKITNQIAKTHFTQMEQLEKQFYADDFITPADESYAYYQAFPLSTVVAMDDANIVGFVNLFPVVDRVFQSIMRGTYNDRNLTVADIQRTDAPGSAPLHMFLSCIVVDAAHQKQGVAMALLRAAVNGYAAIHPRCDYIVTDNVTESGCRFSQRLGLHFLCKSDHRSSVYALAYGEFLESILAR